MKRLLLAGGGQAHVFVLRKLARRSIRDIEVTLVTPHADLLYSAMLPGWIAGHYMRDQIAIPLTPLVQAAHASLLEDRVCALDPVRGVARTERGQLIEFDLLSLAVGSTIASGGIEGAQQYTLSIRPLHAFVDTWSAWAPQLAEADRPKIVVIGAGAGGIEVALAIAYAMRAAGNGTQVKLVTGGALLPGHSERARTLARRALMRLQVRVFDSTATRIESDHVQLQEGTPLTYDLTVLASGAAPPHWLRDSGLALDDAGFVAVDRHLRSTSHERVFAAGDIATLVERPHARSGVFAVHSGPALADNLIRQLEGRPLVSYTPQRTALYLLTTGPQHAIASWNGIAAAGEWAWRWKDRIDRGFVRKLRNP
jgi:pyridine nucleotide-disulfide oxidoreductase family protein